jgi:hypothetical protein
MRELSEAKYGCALPWYPSIYMIITHRLLLTLCSAAPEPAPVIFRFRNRDEE